jgi:acetylornithine/LysW-gamma-L-lysine aminotransferase
VPGFTHVPFNDAAALAAAVDEDTAAVILEIVQGEGGVRPAKAGFLRVARRLCSDGGALLVLDEVQTGFGRTGRMFACEHFDLEPDILCLAKAMAGGLPMGAVVVREGLEAPRGRHGSTFGGNPLVCAAARAVIQEIEDGDLAQRAAGKGNRFVERLSSLRLEEIREIRHMGLMIGIELKRRVKPYLAALAGEGVLAMPAGSTVLRLLPPLVISEEELDEVGEKLALVLSREPQR